jgi:hypothetical protein
VYVLADVPSGRRRWSGLDGLRAIAVAAVVVFHFAPGVLHGGFLGVDIFFVLSGYLITRMIAAEFLRFGSFRRNSCASARSASATSISGALGGYCQGWQSCSSRYWLRPPSGVISSPPFGPRRLPLSGT